MSTELIAEVEWCLCKSDLSIDERSVLNSCKTELQRLQARNAELAQIIADCASAVGAIALPESSIEFKRLLPAEIKAAIAELEAMVRWVLVSEEMPDLSNGCLHMEVDVTVLYKALGMLVVQHMVYDGVWWRCSGKAFDAPDSRILAWKPRPKPYNPQPPEVNSEG